MADPLFLRAPSDALILSTYIGHLEHFQKIQRMVATDKIGYINSSNLDVIKDALRRKEYAAVLSQLGSKLTIARGPHSTRFIFANGGMAAIGPGWLKGIEVFDSDDLPPGEILQNLDHPIGLAADNVYFKRIQTGWYIVLQKI